MHVIQPMLTYQFARARPVIANWFDQRQCRVEHVGLIAFPSTYRFAHRGQTCIPSTYRFAHRGQTCIRIGYYVKFLTPADELRHGDDFIQFRGSHKMAVTGYLAIQVDEYDDPVIWQKFPGHAEELQKQVRVLQESLRPQYEILLQTC